MGSDVDIAAALGDLAVDMAVRSDPDALLESVVAAAITLLPGISWAGIAVVRHRTIASKAPTDDVARMLADLQADVGEGPIFSALDERQTIAVADLDAETRWPRFTPTAVGMGVRSVVAFRLFLTDEALGVLSLYGPQPDAFTDDTVAVGEIFAQHAAVAMAGAAEAEQMQRAIASRDVIGQAKGILMQRDHLTGLQAFAKLTRVSQETNVKLVEVARFLVDDVERGVRG
jgi:GAF domain-containing protein